MRFALALLGLFFCTELNAAAWTLGKGDLQIINNLSFYTSDRYVDAQGHAVSQPSYNKTELNPYIEYGVYDTLTIGLSPSFQYVNQEVGGVDEENANLADSELFARIRLYDDGRNVLSIQPLVKLPGLYDARSRPALGQEQMDYELRLLYGRNLDRRGRFYINTEAAYRVRMEEPGDEWRMAGTFGYRFERWQMMLDAYGTFAADGAGSGGQLLSNTFDYDLVKLQLSGLYWMSRGLGMQLGVFQTVYERNTGEGQGALFAVWYRF